MCNVPLGLIFYELFKGVSKPATLLVVFFSLIGTGIEALALLHHFAPVIILSDRPFLSAIPIEMRQAEAYLSLRLFDFGWSIALVFFGCFCIALGYLIFRSRFLPRFIGGLLVVEGGGYLLNSFTNFLAPAFARYTFPFLAVTAAAEFSLCLWLLVKGIDIARWEEWAASATASSRRSPLAGSN